MVVGVMNEAASKTWVCPGCNGTFLGVQYDPVCLHCKDPLGTAVWSQYEQYKDRPHGWVQWKGTNACIDIHCKCGAHLHADAGFLYYVQCPYCEAIYSVSGFVQLVELTTAEQIAAAKALSTLHVLQKRADDIEPDAKPQSTN